MEYVTRDAEGKLTGGFVVLGGLPAEHAEFAIECSSEQRLNWHSYHAVLTDVQVGEREVAPAEDAPEGTQPTVEPIFEQQWVLELLPAPEYNVAAAKAKLNEAINAWRLRANFSSFPHAGKVVACDALSRSDLDAVANLISLTGDFPEGFPGAWKAVDNSYIMLPDVEAFKSLYASMTAQGTANFLQSQQFKAQAAAAMDEGDIAAIYLEMVQ